MLDSVALELGQLSLSRHLSQVGAKIEDPK